MKKEQPHQTKSRYKGYLEAEQEAVALYAVLAEAEQDPKRSRVFRRLVEAEGRHVTHWAEKLGIAKDDLPGYRPKFRIRFLGWLARQFGTQMVLPYVLRIESADTAMYEDEPEAQSILTEEKGHTQALQNLKEGQYPGDELGHGGWRQAAAGGTFRAAVLGGNDGLVSNFGLVWGVAGGTSDPQIILLAGVAGLVAGAFSMAGGEYVSMRADRDLTEHRLEMERVELQEFPEEEKEELSLIYQLKGLTQNEADILAERIMLDPEVALETMAREELGINPGQLGSPWGAAISSFFSFGTGAIVPVLPYIFSVNSIAFGLSGGLSALALFGTGTALAFVSGKNSFWGGIRMLSIGITAALVTFSVGRLIGISLA
jgi:VIT1/CCC1 family predicted Fe2+/Mn2+ transporter